MIRPNKRFRGSGLFATMIAGTAGLIVAGTAVISTAVQADDGLTPSPPGSHLYIIWPNDGEVINRRRFRIFFGLRNMGVAPAGIERDDTGHHHLLINTELPPLDEEIPADQQYRHFGAGQTEAIVELEPGTHTLQLVMGDHNHVPHNPPVVSRKITITVR